MARTFYSEYVTHCMRFYARHPDPWFKSDADKKNWLACDNTLKQFTQEDREILVTVYREGDTISDNVYEVSKKLGIKQDTVWALIGELEHKIAKRRGLI